MDKLYVMRKEIIIYNNDRNQIKESLYKELIKSFKNPKGEDIIRLESNIEEFLNDPEGTKNKDALFKNMWERYKYIGYKTKHPKEGRSYRNNKIVDMTYEILTHETTANKLLNPGGFEAQKIVGYAIEAYRNPKVRAKYSFEQLLKMRAKDIKNLCYTNKNLVYVDTQTQFYKQNNAAGSLIGTFAVHKIAHAVIEGENYALSVSGILGPEINFTIMGYNFTGLVNIDNTFNKNGEYIGKVLGSLVAASADAVKDPILNLMNINSVTAPILNTLVRMGVTFEDAALFLSQKCITDLLSEYSTENIASPISIGKFIEDKLEIIRKENNISRTNEIKSKNYNKITKKSLISGIYETSEDHEYKVLLAFNRLRKLSTHLKSPTFITRFNSISNAVGPQVIDNLIIENKIQNFSEYIYRNRVNVGAQDILTRHPILNQFFRTVNMAKFILNDIPINSIHFRNLLDQIPDNVKNTLMENRKSLSNFADFYLSTLLIANNVINDMDLEKYIKDFPKHLINTKVKEKYSNNLLINSLQFANDGSTGRVVIKINTSGLDTKAKELLGSSWTELYRQDSNLAIDLFKYCFFKGGIGFNPKTFMSLLPIFIREDIPGYKNTFMHPAPIKIGALLDQFIGNNSNNTSLVPKKELGKDFNAKYNKEKKSITISKKEDISKMLNVGYFKEKKSGIIYKLLTDVTQKEIPYLVYIEIPTLGNNGEYIEINKNYIKKAIDLPTEKTEGQNLTEIENMEVIDFRKTSSSDDAIYEDSKESPEEEQLRINELIDILLLSPKINTREEALEYMKKAKEDSEEKKKAKSKGIKNFLRKKIEEKTGKTPDESKVEEFYSLLCS